VTSAEIRQSFLDFFREKEHTIVPSASLLPDSPNLLFTNAGMNQFVPIFLGQQKPSWNPPRVADTQKCIRAGGKHNDLDDVGLDTYHHTFFEMLGNWSFGDYFKKEAIEWAWELVVERWKLPASRLYATVYKPGPDEPSEFDQEAHDHWARMFAKAGLDPAVHVVEGNKKDNFWMMGDTGPCGPCSELHVDLTPAGDTKGSLVNAGDALCIEIWNLVFIQFNANADGTFSPLPQRHVDTGMGLERITAMIQGTKNFTDFTGIISNYETDVFRPIFDELEKLSGKKYRSTLPVEAPTRLEDFLSFPRRVLADNLDQLDDREHKVFFCRLGLDGGLHRSLSAIGKKFGVSEEKVAKIIEDVRRKVWASYVVQQNADIAFRVIADHIRTLSFAIADGIQPSNEGRDYVLRRILRRAVRYGRTLGFHEPFFYGLVDVLAETMGDVFPELRAKQKLIKDTLRREEVGFNKTLETGLAVFEVFCGFLTRLDKRGEILRTEAKACVAGDDAARTRINNVFMREGPIYAEILSSSHGASPAQDVLSQRLDQIFKYRDFPREIVEKTLELDGKIHRTLSGDAAFKLYDTYGFPLDLTELMARERGLAVDVAGFEKLMAEQRARARGAQKKEAISIRNPKTTDIETKFVGYEFLSSSARVFSVLHPTEQTGVVVDVSPFYAEMGGQVGDTGLIITNTRHEFAVKKTVRSDRAIVLICDLAAVEPGEEIILRVDAPRRRSIERHHTVTHLLHWALHEKVSREATQKGSYVGPEKLTFDFSSAALTAEQKREVEKLVNDKIAENAPVSWTDIPYAEAKKRSDIQQFFGDKYGETVRVVQIGGEPEQLDGYSMELCGGTHVRATGDIGSFRIVREEAIAAGIRRIEAVAGEAAKDWAKEEAARQQDKFEALARKKSGIAALPTFAENAETAAMLQQIDERSAHFEKLEAEVHEWQKQQAKASEADLKSRAAEMAKELRAAHATEKAIVASVAQADGKMLQGVVDALKSHYSGPIFLAGALDGRVALVASVPKELTSQFQANKLIQEIAPIVGGKGGGRPDNAQGAGKDPSKIDEALARARALFSL
jgi:alanyl-tRNA synthetase